ncbi:MAG TPA: hypothetical protein VN699_02790 [Pirellulales bacterium]|nr:hypothetical protein [Pirellulales bacterium]
MLRFRLFPVLMALGVTFNHFHCIGTSARAAGEVKKQALRAQLDGGTQDFASLPKCENETGCICRGAIFIAPPSGDLADLATFQWLPEPRPAIFEAAAPAPNNLGAALLERRHRIAPISGRALRALLGSFLI